ncbi:MAG: uridine kinase [Bdellovibrionales bacterium]|nr:uridine kinase [Bdellovibrionales bacterium]
MISTVRRPCVIAISGGSGSGKTTLARALSEHLGKNLVSLIYQDWYYLDQSSKFDHDGGAVNFDHPQSLEFSLLATHLAALRSRQSIYAPQYDFSNHRRISDRVFVVANLVVIVDGILILHSPELRPLFDIKVFVETSEELRFQRRMARDIEERGRTPEGVKVQFQTQVKPMHDLYVEPSKAHADQVFSGEDPIESMVSEVIRKWRTNWIP